MDRPLIGIATSFDAGDDEPLLPGRPLLFLSPAYAEAVAAGGGVPVLLPLCPDDPGPWLDRLDGLLVPGADKPLPAAMREGPLLPELRAQNPVRYDSDAGWLRAALQRGLPVLGICRGMQTLNEVLGGSLYLRLYPPDQTRRHSQPLPEEEPWHGLEVEPGSLLAELLGPGPAQVNSLHAQGVRQPGEGLRVSGRAPDGVVEAIEATEPGRFCLGLQFHPERLLRRDGRWLRIFTALAQAAARRRAGR